MRKFSRILIADSELDLYLTAHKLKPASMFFVSPSTSIEDENAVVRESEVLSDGIEHTTLKFNPLELDYLRTWISTFKCCYEERKDYIECDDYVERKDLSADHNLGEEKKIVAVNSTFFVGTNERTLERLLNATNYRDLGLALGYPVDAVDAFYERVKQNKESFLVTLIKAKQAGIELPSWLAYLTHVPTGIDLVRGRISPASEEQAIKYKDFVREHNPKLAEAVEGYFAKRTSATRWEIDKTRNALRLYFDEKSD